MPETPYREALKLGKKEYRSCVSKGCYPYLPALEELLPEQGSSGEKDLGLTSVPAEFITGTRTRGRANVFARNFMPLAGENSEFAQKWERLCQSHLKEGIRDPIKVYEYMNRYYVEEGNKRVSVLKFYGAVTIPARVIRVLPVKNDAPEQRRYFELLDFYRLSGVNFLEFCRAGSAQRLQKLLGKAPGQVWTPEERSAFTTAYYAFRAAFLAQGGEDLHLTAGDAMLAFLEVYGVDSLRGKSAGEIRKTVASVWEEIVLRQEEAPIHVKLSPPEKKPGLLAVDLRRAQCRRCSGRRSSTTGIPRFPAGPRAMSRAGNTSRRSWRARWRPPPSSTSWTGTRRRSWRRRSGRGTRCFSPPPPGCCPRP